LERPKFWVFDLDGTLISFPVDWDAVRAELRRLTHTSLEFSPFFLDVLNVTRDDGELRASIFNVIDRYEAGGVEDARLEAGAMEALRSVSLSSKLSLVTMQGRAACDRVVRRLGIGGFFETRFTREDSMERPRQLEMALESLGARKAESIFVGDRVNDLNAARTVGVRFAMIRKRPDSPPADALYRSMSEFAASPLVRG
jgi:HAD superfamily hydrolase (TIGR01549 family)